MGKSWARVARVKDVSLFRDKLKISDVYAQRFWDAFARDEVPVVSHTPVVNCDPGVRAPLDDASSSSLSSHALNDILKHNAQLQQQLQDTLFEQVFKNMQELTKSAKRPVGTPAKLEGGAKPTVTQFRAFVESASNKFSTQNCQTSMILDLWLKDMRMNSTQLESSLSEDEKLRLWEVTHAYMY